MRKNTALSWANSIDITEAEFNEYLVELGYQIQNTISKKWERTPKGMNHSNNFFGQLYWDVDAFFDVLKLRGKRTRTYFYCDKCGSYNRIPLEEMEWESFCCSQCGFEMQLEKNISWWCRIKAKVKEEACISEIIYNTWIEPLQCRILEDRIVIESAFGRTEMNYIRDRYKKAFKDVIKRETGKEYIISFIGLKELLERANKI